VVAPRVAVAVALVAAVDHRGAPVGPGKGHTIRQTTLERPILWHSSAAHREAMSLALDLRWAAAGLAVAWGAWEGRQSRRNRATSEQGQSADRHSLPLIFGVMTLSIAGAATLGLAREAPPRSALAATAALVGLAAMVAGFAIRLAAMRTLARQFTHRVAIVPQHQLVRHGLYRWLRHPAYTGQLVVMLGLGVAEGSATTVAVALLPALAVMIFRIRLEERVLALHFGEQYRAYARATWRLLPGIW
jgi:protein-S-isoprenylcysteine O-methyltransferase